MVLFFCIYLFHRYATQCSLLLLVSRKDMAQKHRSKIPVSEPQHEETETDESASSISSEDEEEDEIEKELADVTFEELQKARSNGAHAFFQKPKKDQSLKRANKNRPMEVSCKKPVPVFREVIQAPKKVIRDPRFESLCGNLDTDGYVHL